MYDRYPTAPHTKKSYFYILVTEVHRYTLGAKPKMTDFQSDVINEEIMVQNCSDGCLRIWNLLSGMFTRVKFKHNI